VINEALHTNYGPEDNIMQDYTIMTDSTCDLTAQQVAELNIKIVPMNATVGEISFFHYSDAREMSFQEFYARLRAGEKNATSAVSVGEWSDAFESELKTGMDVLAIIFSSALSRTYDNACMAAEDMKSKYPERQLIVIDSLCAALGQGLLVKMASEWRAEGKDIKENAAHVEASKLHLCHEFTVTDLAHLRRGGRISRTTAIVGQALGIQPILHVDNNGKLVGVGKARGRKNAIHELVNRMAERVIEPEKQHVFITHGDCLEEAEALAKEIRECMGVKQITINFLGPIAGGHAGPGTLAVFYIGRER
jgi:DegV family protein with EDD domain